MTSNYLVQLTISIVDDSQLRKENTGDKREKDNGDDRRQTTSLLWRKTVKTGLHSIALLADANPPFKEQSLGESCNGNINKPKT